MLVRAVDAISLAGGQHGNSCRSVSASRGRPAGSGRFGDACRGPEFRFRTRRGKSAKAWPTSRELGEFRKMAKEFDSERSGMAEERIARVCAILSGDGGAAVAQNGESGHRLPRPARPAGRRARRKRFAFPESLRSGIMRDCPQAGDAVNRSARRRVGGVVTQRIANPCTPVRFRYSPPRAGIRLAQPRSAAPRGHGASGGRRA